MTIVAHETVRSAKRALKRTGFWTPRAGNEILLHITEPGAHLLEPKENDSILIIIDENAETIILERGAGSYAIDIVAGPNARVTYASETRSAASADRFAHLGDDASIRWVDVPGGERVTANVTTYLGRGSDARLASCFLGTDEQSNRINAVMIHAGDNSTSNMLTRGALLGSSSGAYDGLIRILPDARGCDAYQRGEFLILSSDARMHAQPNLEIGNDAVKCSHGVSLSRVDEEQLFYFKARGIQEGEAITLIVEGFFAAIIDQLPDATAARGRIASRIAR